VDRAKNKLFRNLTVQAIPLSILSQYMPEQFNEVCQGKIHAVPKDLVNSHIMAVTGKYSRACGLSAKDIPVGKSYLYPGK
jgi:D-tagatose-1,6-bisphosphate aldolase subunit GatZ/KbaZ